jgi:ATPase subunit of ABC transporter with duplicated ATPase domains
VLLSVDITEKSFGPKTLFSRVNFAVDDGEKIGIIGRNGVGKSTIFNILAGIDADFTGDIIRRRGTQLVATSQEYHAAGSQTVVEYILSGLPEFARLSKVIREFTTLEHPSKHQLDDYAEALERFSFKGYYHVEDQVREELKAFQLDHLADAPFSALSGGQKRLSEVIKIMHSSAHLALVDEPTNFMDYVAKAQFIDWMQSAPEAICIITHDRDVLRAVDRIIEIKDGTAFNYRGNYEFYLRENASRTSNAMGDYEIVERRIANLKQKLIEYRRLKDKSQHVSATVKQFKRLEAETRAELAELQAIDRPSFWIDKASVEQLGYKASDRYDKYKARNLKLGLKSAASKSQKVIVEAQDLSVGYEVPLFAGVNFQLRESEALEIRGRNGAGKTTLLKALLRLDGPRICAGTARLDPHVRLGIYQQEVDTKYFDLKLSAAIAQIYRDQQLSISDQTVRKLMANYLFTETDREVPVRNLSGGQKARLQIIAMLSSDPTLLILDEPTSHLDLPSIEELEQALLRYRGAILYISHDNYFRAKLGGQVITL